MFVIPGYRIEEKIYESHNSVIYRGIREEDEEPVILKMLRTEYPEPAELTRFRREYVMAEGLRMEGVIRVHAMLDVGSRMVIVMEDFGADSLAKRMTEAGGGLPLSTFLNLAIRITDTLGQVHRRNIIHKDINPTNIVWNPAADSVKLIDFGISTELNRETQAVLNPDVLEGTLAYMSPEQTGRMNRTMDYRTDLYSLGVTFYQMLTGRIPFESDDSMEMVHCHIARVPKAPHEVDKTIARPLSDIVMKLMAKMAEDRYKSAMGLAADLRRCLLLLTEEGAGFELAVGEEDVSDKFQIPGKLYGRKEEIKALLSTFESVSLGAAEMMLVAGYSGVGKTSLIEEIHRPIVKRRGYFISGKFDQYRKDVPYASLIQALRKLVRYLLTESDDRVRLWKERLLAALGDLGKIITDVIPELTLILGPQPEVLTLAGVEAQRRFNDLFEKFLGVFCTQEHPLVLFLDDLQWADPASLKLIRVLMTGKAERYLMIVGAYRDNEVTPSHPLMLTLDEIGKKKAFTTLTLSPLEPADAAELIADTLDDRLDRTGELAALVQSRTGGNPFFLTQFLSSLYANRMLDFDPEKRQWQWDLAKIRQLSGSDNVVELMVAKINKLPEITQELMMLASCLGNQFDLSTMAVIAKTSPAEVVKGMWGAVLEELVVPLSESYRLFQWSHEEEGTADPSAVSYRFFHDRIQEAAYSKLSVERRKEIHLEAGRLILANAPEEAVSERIFDIVNHLNFSESLLTERDERERLGRLNLSAGKKAKAGTAYEAALAYLTRGMTMLTEAGWDRHYDVMYELYRERIECEFLCGNLAESERVFQLAAERTKTKRETGELYELMIRICHINYDYARGIELGKEGLRLFGIEIPDDPEAYAKALEEALAFIKGYMAENDILDLENAPAMEDADHITCCGLIHELWACLFMAGHDQVLLPVLVLIRLSVTHGQSSVTAVGHIFYALILSMQQDYDNSYAFGRLAMKLKEKYFNPLLAPKVHNSFCNFVNHYKNHLKTNIPIYEESYGYCVQSGEIWWGAWAASFIRTGMLVKGDSLDEVWAVGNKYADYIESSEFAPLVLVMRAEQAKVSNLMDETGTKLSIDTESFDEAETIAAMEAMPFGLGLFWHYVYRSFSLYLYGENKAALAAIMKSDENKAHIPNLMMYPDHFFFDALIIAANFEDFTEEEKARYRERLDADIAQMALWRKHCPENFLHRHLLMSAERARMDGEDLVAMELYEAAAEAARENGYLHHGALANELAGKFFLGMGSEKAARGYLTEARYLYLRWGAKRKVRYFDEQYPGMVMKMEERKEGTITTATITATRASESIGFSSRSLDFASVMKASQAISGEIVLERLLTNLMHLLMENAGARKGFLILSDEGRLRIEASGTLDREETVVLQSVAVVPETKELPVSLLQYVARTKENVVLSDAAKEGPFTRDAYVVRARPRSILCMPILRQSELAGILYLENNLTTGAFTPDRLEVLAVLASQTAISLENANLYANLEEKVKSRTAELKVAHEKILVLEKEATEMQMAGGFAHEMRNALVGSKLVIEQALGYDNGDTPASLPLANNRTLKEIYLSLTGQLTEGALEEVLSQMKKIFANEEHLEEMLQVIYRSVSRGLAITKQTMDFSRVGQEETAGEPIHMDELIETVIGDYRTDLTGRGIEVLLDLRGQDAKGGPCRIAGQEAHFYSIVSNIVLNARDALIEAERPAGALRRIRIESEVGRGNYTVRFSDTGVGISPENIDRIFDAFFSMKPDTGTGLGLGVVKKIISLYNGAIDVESDVGSGTTFTVTLPVGV